MLWLLHLLIIKNGVKFFAPNDQLRAKYHHAPDLYSPSPATLVANREAKDGTPKIEGYHLYNDSTRINTFFDKNGRRYRTNFETNSNMM